MQPQIKYYQPGKIITLFDASQGDSLYGSLSFQRRNYPRKSKTYFKPLKKDYSKYRFFDKNLLLKRNISVPVKRGFNNYFELVNNKFLVWEKLILNYFQSSKPNLELVKNIRVKKFYPQLAVVFLLFSVFALVSVVLPIFAAGFNFSGLPTPTSAPKVIPKTWSGETLTEFNARDQREREKLEIRDFRIIIPKINIDSNIIPYVDSTNEDEYKDQLMNGVAHAKGSYLPYENGPMYLFSHSTDSIFHIVQYNAKFYALHDLEEGDPISVILNGTEYKYKVKSKMIINPDQIDLIQQTKADLIMQTCWPPGTDWQRLVVYADKI